MTAETVLESENSIQLDVRDWEIRIENTKRKNRVKLTFKLSKEESAGFEAFMTTVKPDKLSKEDFVKVIFFNGVEALNKEFTEVAKKYAEEQAGALALDGIDPTEVLETVTGVEEEAEKSKKKKTSKKAKAKKSDEDPEC